MKSTLVAADLTKKIAFGRIKVLQITGWNNQAGDLFIQFFESPTAAASAVPGVKSLYAPADTAFDWSFNTGLELSELLVALSSVEASYTAVGAGGGIDATIIYETDFPYITATTITGDLTTGVASKQVWAEASGYKKLRRLDVKNNSGADAFAFVQASDAANTGDFGATLVPVKIANGATAAMQFGIGGLVPFRNDAGTVRKGCTVRLAAAATLPATFDAVANYNIRAVYE